jgi:hypothetical protein
LKIKNTTIDERNTKSFLCMFPPPIKLCSIDGNT